MGDHAYTILPCYILHIQMGDHVYTILPCYILLMYMHAPTHPHTSVDEGFVRNQVVSVVSFWDRIGMIRNHPKEFDIGQRPPKTLKMRD